MKRLYFLIILFSMFLIKNVYADNNYDIKPYYPYVKVGGYSFNNVNQVYWTYDNTAENKAIVFYLEASNKQYFDSPYSAGDTINLVMTYCSTGVVLNNVFSGYNNKIDYIYKTGEKCNFTSWQGDEYKAYLTLTVDTVFNDEVDDPSGTYYTWYIVMNTQAFYFVNNYGYNISTRFIDLAYINSTDYNATILQMKNLGVQNLIYDSINSQSNQQHTDSINTQNAINGVNSSINDSNIDSPNSFFSDLQSKLAQNSTISSLITLPITFYTSVLNSVNGTCTSFNLGTIKNNTIIMPCIDISHYIGSTLWSVIDILFSGLFIFHISKKFIKVFENFSSLKDGDILDD